MVIEKHDLILDVAREMASDYSLTDNQAKVLPYLFTKRRTQEIADDLGVSYYSIIGRINRISDIIRNSDEGLNGRYSIMAEMMERLLEKIDSGDF